MIYTHPPLGPWGRAVAQGNLLHLVRTDLEQAIYGGGPPLFAGPCHCPVPCVCRRDPPRRPFDGLFKIMNEEKEEGQS
jgi:hypothetical protein